MALPDPVTGKMGKPQWSASFPSAKAADAHQRKTRQEIADGRYAADGGLTVAAWLGMWMDQQRRDGLRPSTLSRYQNMIDKHLIPHLGAHQLSALTPRHVQAMINSIADTPWLRAGSSRPRLMAPGSLVTIRSCLRSALGEAMRQELIHRNVATLVTLPKVTRKSPIALDADRIAAFVAVLPGHKLHAMMHVAAIYGLRRGELVGLPRDAIDFKQRLLLIRSNVVDVPGDHPCPHCEQTHKRIAFGKPKTEAGERAYPLVDEVADVLRRELDGQERRRAELGAAYLDHLLAFARPDGLPWNPDWVSRQWKKLLVESGAADGMDRVPPLKTARATMITQLHREGLSLETIQGVAGHVPGSEVTKKHYLSVTAEQARHQFESMSQKAAGRGPGGRGKKGPAK